MRELVKAKPNSRMLVIALVLLIISLIASLLDKPRIDYTFRGKASRVLGVSDAPAYQPILHLRKTATPPPIIATLQDPATASAWYPSSPTWFGGGGKTGDRNHNEILATYDDSALYIAWLSIDRSTIIYPKGTSTDLTLVDCDAIWIETPEGKRFYFLSAVDSNYPPRTVQASGDLANFNPKTNSLSGWTSGGWYAGNKTIQQTMRIPWTTLSTTMPALNSNLKINFLNYNQTSSNLTSTTVNKQAWAIGSESLPDSWGILAFDEAANLPATTTSPEAKLTLRPATGFGEEITLRAGNAADLTNEWKEEAITQSNWNDWDPIDFTIKEFLQFDLSSIPKDRQIISATLKNHYRGNFQADPTGIYLHVVRLENSYNPQTVNMLTSPRPVENGFRRLVETTEVGNWIDFDVTDAVSKSFAGGSGKAAFALVGSSGNITNGKIWDNSSGRADWYDRYRPRLVITFGSPNYSYPEPVQVGSLNYKSVATASSKNKLTNR